MKTLITLSVLLALSGCAQADPYTPEQYVRAIIGEAENHGYEGLFAVACAIQARPERLEGVYGLNSARVDLAPDYVKNWAETAYYDSLEPGNCDFMQGADMWHSGDAPKSWSHVPMVFIKEIGGHRFYRRLTNE